jgi:hypothetical protein
MGKGQISVTFPEPLRDYLKLIKELSGVQEAELVRRCVFEFFERKVPEVLALSKLSDAELKQLERIAQTEGVTTIEIAVTAIRRVLATELRQLSLLPEF